MATDGNGLTRLSALPVNKHQPYFSQGG
ncbi:hypothetical protein DFAR_3480007 [Desulfarculales bacterium]